MVVNEQVLSTMPLGVPPSDWDAVYLEDVTSKIGSGETPRGGANVYQSHGMPFIRSQNVYDHEFRIDGLAHISTEGMFAPGSSDSILHYRSNSALNAPNITARRSASK
jgi:hypothetical protein